MKKEVDETEPRERVLSVRLGPEAWDAMHNIATRYDTDVSKLLRIAVRCFLKQCEKRGVGAALEDAANYGNNGGPEVPPP